MFSYNILKDDRIVILTASKKITIDDYQNIAVQFFSDINANGIHKILMDYRMYEGLASDGAETMAFEAWREIRSIFDSIAVVGDDLRTKEARSFVEFFGNSNVDVRLFRSVQFGEALTWLKHKGRVDDDIGSIKNE